MSLTVVQAVPFGFANTAPPSNTLSFTPQNAGHDLIVITTCGRQSLVVTASGLGATWDNQYANQGATVGGLSVWHGTTPTAAAGTLTLSFSGSTTQGLTGVIIEVSGKVGNPFDSIHETAGAVTNPVVVSDTVVSSAGAVVVLYCATDGASPPTTPGAPWTYGADSSGNPRASAFAYQNGLAAGAHSASFPRGADGASFQAAIGLAVVPLVTTSITATPSSVPAGMSRTPSIVVTGSQFGNNLPVTATLDGVAVTLTGTTTTDGSGNLAGVSFLLPTVGVGAHTLTVTDGTNSASSTITGVNFGAITPHEIQDSLNKLAGTTGLDAQAAANKWAGTQNLDLIAALNVKAHNVLPQYKDMNGVCNQLAGTQYDDAQQALSNLAYGTP